MNSTWWVKPEELDEEQKQIISLPYDKSYLISGPPGSGKTNLLLLRAKYLSLSGHPNILILTFNRPLCEFIRSGAKQYKLPKDRIMTSQKWIIDTIREHGGKVSDNENFDRQRATLIAELQGLLKKNNIQKYEAVFLDESQDYLPEEICLYNDMSKKLFAVADRQQKIYSGRSPIEDIKRVVDETYQLHHHYRNGIHICKLADGILSSKEYGKLAETSNYNEKDNPSLVERFQLSNLEEQCNRVLERLDAQLKAYPNEYIGILCPKRNELEIISKIFLESKYGDKCVAISDSRHREYFVYDKPIIISTIHSSKGLEYRTLHLLSFESVKSFRERQKKTAFMAITRAKTLLAVYHTDSLPGYIEQAFANMNGPVGPPTIAEIFGE